MSFLYTDFRTGLWDPTANTLGRVDVLSDPISMAMLDITLYVADPDADVSLADIPSAAVVATQAMSGLIVLAAVLSADPTVFASFTGAECAAAAIFKDTGTPATSALIAYLDTFDAGMPVTPDGTDFTMNAPAGGFISIPSA